jgi:hypothetical protein
MCYEAWTGSRCIWAGIDRLESSLALRVVYFLAYEWSLLVGISCLSHLPNSDAASASIVEHPAQHSNILILFPSTIAND